MVKAAERDIQGLSEARLKKVTELEANLRSILQTRGPNDESVQSLRNKIRDAYATIATNDVVFAEKNDVLQALWRVHYKRIEEFRVAIRQAGATASKASSTAPLLPGASGSGRVDSRQDGNGSRRRVQLPPAAAGSTKAGRSSVSHQAAGSGKADSVGKTMAVFKSFLSEASGFFHDLISKLKARHGMPTHFSFPEECKRVAGDSPGRVEELQLCRIACHRCLIYLGDLARYRELLAETKPSSRDWSVAAGYYLQAASIWPKAGNPHNQLAVLATYIDDELLAVYRYARSLALVLSFPTSRENLFLLFEKNEQKYSAVQFPQRKNEAGSPREGTSRDGSKEVSGAKTAGKADSGAGDGDIHIEAVRKRFRICFVRLVGILFTRASLDAFGGAYLAAMTDLEELLAGEDDEIDSRLASDQHMGPGHVTSGALVVVHVIAILIFTVHNISSAQQSENLSYADVLQQSSLQRHAITAVFECAGRLLKRGGTAAQVVESPLLPGLVVFMEWLASHVEYAMGVVSNDREGSARLFFWGQYVIAANKLLDVLPGAMHVLQQVREGVGLGGKNRGEALWEDIELRGFQPLEEVHEEGLDFGGRSLQVYREEDEERLKERGVRLVMAGYVIARKMEEKKSGRSLGFDEDSGKFFLWNGAGVKGILRVSGPTVSVKASEDNVLRGLPEENGGGSNLLLISNVREGKPVGMEVVGEAESGKIVEVDDVGEKLGHEIGPTGVDDEDEEEPMWATVEAALLDAGVGGGGGQTDRDFEEMSKRTLEESERRKEFLEACVPVTPEEEVIARVEAGEEDELIVFKPSGSVPKVGGHIDIQRETARVPEGEGGVWTPGNVIPGELHTELQKNPVNVQGFENFGVGKGLIVKSGMKESDLSLEASGVVEAPSGWAVGAASGATSMAGATSTESTLAMVQGSSSHVEGSGFEELKRTLIEARKDDGWRLEPNRDFLAGLSGGNAGVSAWLGRAGSETDLGAGLTSRPIGVIGQTKGGSTGGGSPPWSTWKGEERVRRAVGLEVEEQVAREVGRRNMIIGGGLEAQNEGMRLGLPAVDSFAPPQRQFDGLPLKSTFGSHDSVTDHPDRYVADSGRGADGEQITGKRDNGWVVWDVAAAALEDKNEREATILQRKLQGEMAGKQDQHFLGRFSPGAISRGTGIPWVGSDSPGGAVGGAGGGWTGHSDVSRQIALLDSLARQQLSQLKSQLADSDGPPHPQYNPAAWRGGLMPPGADSLGLAAYEHPGFNSPYPGGNYTPEGRAGSNTWGSGELVGGEKRVIPAMDAGQWLEQYTHSNPVLRGQLQLSDYGLIRSPQLGETQPMETHLSSVFRGASLRGMEQSPLQTSDPWQWQGRGGGGPPVP